MAKGLYKEWLEPENLVILQGWKRNGLTDAQIAQNIGINARTLDKWKAKYGRIRQALKIGRSQSNFMVEGELFKKAMKGNTTAMIFYLKNNWRDKYNDSKLSQEERELIKVNIRKAKADADIKEAKAKILKENGQDVEQALDKMLDVITKEDKKDGTK